MLIIIWPIGAGLRDAAYGLNQDMICIVEFKFKFMAYIGLHVGFAICAEILKCIELLGLFLA